MHCLLPVEACAAAFAYAGPWLPHLGGATDHNAHGASSPLAVASNDVATVENEASFPTNTSMLTCTCVPMYECVLRLELGAYGGSSVKPLSWWSDAPTVLEEMFKPLDRKTFTASVNTVSKKRRLANGVAVTGSKDLKGTQC